MTSIKLAIQNNIGRITLNRPDVLNSITREMGAGLLRALKDCGNAEEVRAVVITGEGKAFCAGQDLSEVTDAGFDADLGETVEEVYNPIINSICELEKPVLCAVNGVAAGAGANIALSCDIVIASESSSFIQAFSKIGLIPDSGGTYFLPRLIGLPRAAALMMLGEKVSAKDAFDMGMIFRIFPDETFQSEAHRLAETLAKMPTAGLALTKKALNKSFDNSLADQLELERRFQSEAGRTYDYKEGVRAFLEKRKPEFKGN